MDFSLLAAFLAGGLVGAGAMLPLWRGSHRRAIELAAALDTTQALQAQLRERAASAEATREMLHGHLTRAEEAQTRAEQAAAESARAAGEAQSRVSLAEQSVAQARRESEQRIQEMQARQMDWEKTKQEFIQASQAAALKTGTELSTKLLADHQRESETARKTHETMAEEKARIFTERLEQLKATMAMLHGQTEDTAKRTHSLWQALSSPGGAGRLSEIGLANLLKNLGLTESQDYDLQFSIGAHNTEEGGGIRPDALIYLPQNAVMIVDSKASKHILEFGEHGTGSIEETTARTRLRGSMQTHLKALGGKEYRQKIEAHFRKTRGAEALGRTVLVMYLPHESLLQHLLEIEPAFVHTAKSQYDIIVTGPNGLHSLLGLMSSDIMIQRQLAGQEQILQQVKAMVDGAAKAFSHVEKISKGMKAAADGLESFTNSLNRFFLPKAHGLAKLGVEVPKSLPMKLRSIEVRLSDDVLTIEGEAQEADAKEIESAPPLLRVVQS